MFFSYIQLNSSAQGFMEGAEKLTKVTMYMISYLQRIIEYWMKIETDFLSLSLSLFPPSPSLCMCVHTIRTFFVESQMYNINMK